MASAGQAGCAGGVSTARSEAGVSMHRLRINVDTIDERDCWRPYLGGNVISVSTSFAMENVELRATA